MECRHTARTEPCKSLAALPSHGPRLPEAGPAQGLSARRPGTVTARMVQSAGLVFWVKARHGRRWLTGASSRAPGSRARRVGDKELCSFSSSVSFITHGHLGVAQALAAHPAAAKRGRDSETDPGGRVALSPLRWHGSVARRGWGQVSLAVLVDCFVDASEAAEKAEADALLAEARASRQVRLGGAPRLVPIGRGPQGGARREIQQHGCDTGCAHLYRQDR